MVYVNEGILKQFHADVAAFIRGQRTESKVLLGGNMRISSSAAAPSSVVVDNPVFMPNC